MTRLRVVQALSGADIAHDTMLGWERKGDGMRNASETVLWAWLITVAVASVIVAVLIFFLQS